MKNKILIPIVLLGLAGLMNTALAQEAAPAAPAAPAAAAAPVATAAPAPEKKKAPAVKRAKKAAAKPAAAVTVPATQEQAPSTAAVTAAQNPQAEAAMAAPAAVPPVVPAAARRSSCPNCFEPLVAGYNVILADLKPWMEEMDVQASAFDAKLSAIQKEINIKDDAIEKARQDTDKKAGKAAVKLLSKERKQLLNAYTGVSDEKDAFYKKFSKEVEKRMKGYNKIAGEKLRITLSAASD